MVDSHNNDFLGPLAPMRHGAFPNLQVAIIVQARMGATRLAGKPLLKVLDKPLLVYLIERLKRVKLAHRIVIATTVKLQDDPIASLAEMEGVEVVRGDEEDVLSRYLLAAKASDVLIRITADCPLIDPELVDTMISTFLNSDVDYLSNTLKRSFPRGEDIEIFSRNALEKASLHASALSEREHVTLYIYRHPELFKLENVMAKEDASHFRLTVDTPEDFTLIQKILLELYPKNPRFNLADLLKLMKERPDLAKINEGIEQKLV